MNKNYISETVQQLKEKFCQFFQDRKKVTALDNYSLVAPFKHRKFLELLKHCLREAFLVEQEERFLNHLLDSYEIKYLEWCHRTPWLKRKMHEMAQKPIPQPQILFNFEKVAKTSVNVPVHLLPPKRTYTKRV